MSLLRYCPKCGEIFISYECSFCEHKMYETKYTFSDYLKDTSIEKRIMEEYVKKSPEFDEELFKKREAKENEEIHRPSSAAGQRILRDMGAIPQQPKCPTCGSTKIRRISTTEKVTSTVLFGIFSNKRKYQFECLNPNCKYKW